MAAAYRALEGEGLVEIRRRQGVFLREQETSDRDAVARIGPDEPVLVSRAVADRLERDFSFVVHRGIPVFDPPSTGELARVPIRLNLEAREPTRRSREK